jgi:uncharacterized protein (DUF2267 family)
VATNATLEALGQRITGGEAKNIASQLPERLGDRLRAEAGDVGKLSVKGFLDRVGDHERDRGQVDPSAADVEEHVRGVLSALGDTVSGSELEDARDRLPSEFDPLFEPIDTSEQQA